MDDTLWPEVSRQLDELLALDDTARQEALQQLAGEQPDVYQAVQELLQADRRAGDFMAAPVAVYAADLCATLGDDALLPFRLGPYEVQERLGEGGMGEVFVAWDERLRRHVAIKRLPAWAWRSDGKERFRREARAASTLDHANICTIFDFGTSDDGEMYLVMARYRGETLAQRLDRGPLPWTVADDILRQVARGLAHAHRQGIVHRDIKPSNLMLTAADDASAGGSSAADASVGGHTDGRSDGDRFIVKILDFGIAKALDATGLTGAGASPGTPAYMAPEQRDGGAVDGRTDLWALGCVVCEMVLGRRPKSSEWVDDTGRRALRNALRNVQPAPPEFWLDLVVGLLAIDMQDRVPSAEALLEALESPRRHHRWAQRRASPRALALRTLVVVGLALGAFFWVREFRQGSAPMAGGDVTAENPGTRRAGGQTAGAVSPGDEVQVPVLAVLPFEVVTGESGASAATSERSSSLGHGLAQLVRDQLAPLRQLHVASGRRSARLLAAAPAVRDTAAAEDGVTYLLSGEIVHRDSAATGDEDAWHLQVRLVHSLDGRQVTALRRSVSSSGEVLALSELVSDTVRRSLALPAEEAVDVFSADFAAAHPLAYQAFVDGLNHFVAYRMGAAEASWREALHLAPDFLMARYRLAHVLAVEGRTEEARREMARAMEERRRAPRRQRLYVEALAAYIDRRLEEALQLYEELCRLLPYDSEARYLKAQVAYDLGRYEEVLADAELLTRLEPQHHIAWSLRGGAQLALGNAHQAVLDLTRYVQLEPGSANAHHLLADAYRAQGDLGLAAVEYRAALEADGEFHVARVALAQIHALDGDLDGAERQLARLIEDTTASPRWRLSAAFDLAYLQHAGGRFRQAVATFEAVDGLLQVEAVRYAESLAARAQCYLELGETTTARRLAEQALEHAPGVATRYLFTLGRVHVATGDESALGNVIEEIEAAALPPENPDRTEPKAAAFLRGLLARSLGDMRQAESHWTRAVGLEGYEYALYAAHLGDLYGQLEQWPKGLATLHQAMTARDPLHPRFDLELDRRRARLRRGELLTAMGRPDEGWKTAAPLAELWARSDALNDERRRLEALRVASESAPPYLQSALERSRSVTQ